MIYRKMITRYKDFIKENIAHGGITHEEIELLEKYNIKNYTFNEKTGLIDVNQDVRLDNKKLIELPNIRFGTITGSYTCIMNELTTLKNSPKIVTEMFNCRENHLTSLEFCPEKVDGVFVCGNNNITSLYHCPKRIGDTFYCNSNNLTTLEFGPEYVGGYFYCDGNLLENLEFCPKYVGEVFSPTENPLKSIEDYPICWIDGLVINGENICHFDDIMELIKEKPQLYRVLIESKNKIRFHQQVMRDNPDLIQYYDTIAPPSKRTII